MDSLLADIDAERYGLIDHFLLVRHGRVVADRRWDHAARYAELLAAQDDTAAHQYNTSDPRRAAATQEDFLTMRSGIEWATPGQSYPPGSAPH